MSIVIVPKDDEKILPGGIGGGIHQVIIIAKENLDQWPKNHFLKNQFLDPLHGVIDLEEKDKQRLLQGNWEIKNSNNE